jgi:hypothetical protein
MRRRMRVVAKLRQIARENPEAAIQVIRRWLRETPAEARLQEAAASAQVGGVDGTGNGRKAGA